MAEPEKSLTVAATPVADYVTALVIVTENGQQVSVPVNAEANKLRSQVMAAKLCKFVDEQITLYSGSKKALPAAIIKDLVTSASKVEDMARFAYANLLTPEEGGEAAGTTAVQMMKAAAEGMTAAHIKASSGDRMKRITDLGKKKTKTDEGELEVWTE